MAKKQNKAANTDPRMTPEAESMRKGIEAQKAAMSLQSYLDLLHVTATFIKSEISATEEALDIEEQDDLAEDDD